MVSMALTISWGPDNATSPAASSCCGTGGCVGLIASPGVSSLTLPHRVARRREKCSVGKLDAFPESPTRTNSFQSSCPPRRVHFAAELKTFRSMEVDDDNLEHRPLFSPPLGWPFSALAAPDLHLLEKTKARVTLPGPPVILDKQNEEAGVSRFFGRVNIGESEDLYRQWIATEFSAAVQSGSPPPRQKQENSEQDNYYVNTGYAIRTLREELPNMFYRKLNFEIYREDITFRDPMNVFTGIDNYKLIFWALRFHGRIFFKALWVDIGRVWQPHDKVIMVRWTVRGIPRVPWEAQGHFEGTSEYRLDKDGKIYEHKVDNVIFNSPPTQKYKAISVMDLVRVAGGQTNPTPSFYAQAVVLFAILYPYLQQFTWVRFYWALRSTLVLNNKGECCNELSLNA